MTKQDQTIGLLLGTTLGQLQREQGRSLARLARRLGVGHQRVAQWRDGLVPVPRHAWALVAEVAGVDWPEPVARPRRRSRRAPTASTCAGRRCGSCRGCRISATRRTLRLGVSVVGTGRGDDWAPNDDALLRQHAGRLSAADLTALVNREGSGILRTVAGVRHRATRLGLSLAKAAECWYPEDAGRLLGVSRRTVRAWMTTGRLASRPWRPGGQRQVVDRVEIERFIRTYPWAYDWRAVAPPFRALAEVIQRRDPYLTIGAVAALWGGLRPQGVRQRLYRQGVAVERIVESPHSPLLVRAADVARIGARR